jgi:hypothetical protein
MAEDKRKIHCSNGVLRTACGLPYVRHTSNGRVKVRPPRLTDDPDQVTCEGCRWTNYWMAMHNRKYIAENWLNE